MSLSEPNKDFILYPLYDFFKPTLWYLFMSVIQQILTTAFFKQDAQIEFEGEMRCILEKTGS